MSEKYNYGIKQGDGFSIWLQGKHCVAQNKILTLTKEQHEELQNLIAGGRSDIAQTVVFLDENAAEAIARQHIADQRGAAHQGSTHSQANSERQGIDTKLTPVRGNEPAGMTVMERLRASRDNVLSSAVDEQKLKTDNVPLEVIEEDAVHAGDLAPPAG